MDMKTLKTAVVGLGRIGWYTHIPEILKRGGQLALVAVVDVSQERLEEAKQAYGVRGYTKIEQMIQSEKPDLIVIATPTHLHYEHACTAMRMGVDVFLDKPMTVDYAAACAVAQCARETGRKLMVFQPHRACAAVNQLKHIIDTGRIGKLISIHFTRTDYACRADWQAFQKFGGGMLNNYGAHHIDSLVHMAQDRVNRLYCSKDIVAAAGDAEDVVKIVFQTYKGITLQIDINQAAALAGPAWVIYGQDGAIISEESPEGKLQFRMRWFDPGKLPPITASESLAAANRSYGEDLVIPWEEEVIPEDSRYEIDFYEKVCEYFAEDKAPYVPIEESLYVMELIQRCHKDAAQDQ